MSRLVPLLLVGLLVGCTATRSTVHLVKAEQALLLAREAEAPERAPYAWTLAEQLVLKAREEWASSDFGPAEALSVRGLAQANVAAEQARTAPRPERKPFDANLPEAADAPVDAPVVAPQAPQDNPWPDGNVTGEAPWGDQ